MKNSGYVRSALLLPLVLICAGFLTNSFLSGTGSSASMDTVIAPAASLPSLEMPREVELLAANDSVQTEPAAAPSAGAPAPGTVIQPFVGQVAAALPAPEPQATPPAAPRTSKIAIGFEERVQAQEAIERVYYNHRMWPGENPGTKPAFEDAVSLADIEGRVKLALQESAALQEYWNSPITAQQLQDEINRMVRDSHSPEMLQELFAALNNDPVLIAECLARPALADRLVRDKYAMDTRLHGDAKSQAESFLHGLVPATLRTLAGERFHSVMIGKAGGPETEGLSADDPGLVRLSADGFAKAEAEFPEAGRISAVADKADAFVILYTESKTDALLTGGAVAFPKKSFEVWLSEVAPTLPYMVLSAPGASYIIAQIEQKTDATADAAPALPDRLLQTSVWTGAETLVWGGAQDALFNLGTGARYLPALDCWMAMSVTSLSPSARQGHTAVWTGREMIVWGGYSCAFPCMAVNTGGRYNPMADTWSATTLEGACPTPSFGHAAAWTGTEMAITGGIAVDGNPVNASGRYNPAANTWAAGLETEGQKPNLPPTQSDSTRTQGACSGANLYVYATVGTTGTGYTTLQAAFAAINAGTHKGVIQIEICGNTTETSQAILYYSGYGSTSSYTSIKIYPIVAARTITGSLATSIIELDGASNVTIDGSLSGTGTDQSLTISNSNTGATSAVVWLASYNASYTCGSDSIKNCIITGNASTTTQYGIYAGSSTIGSAAAAAQSNNTIQNCTITTAQNGIFVYGYATSPYDSNWTITGNTTGSTTTAAKLEYRGISIQNATNAAVNNNTILGVNASTSTNPYGIYVGTSMSGGTLNGNVIHDIKNTRTTSTMCAGLDLSATTTASNLTVANNVIYDVASYGAASFTTNGWGMYITSGGGYKIYYNSIRLTTNQTSTAAYPAAFNVGSGVTTASSLDVRNNVIVNSQTVGAFPMAILIESAITVFSYLDYNDEYAALGYTGGLASTIYSGAAAWQAATGKEAHSISLDPLFNSTTNLALQPGSPVLAAGTPVSVTTDITGATRNGSTPTLGAYECAPPYIMYALLTNTTSTSNRSFTGVIITANCSLNTTSGTKPRCYYKRSTDTNAWNDNTSGTSGWKYVEANGSTSPFDFTLDYSKLSGGTGVSAGNTVQYFVVAQDLETTPQVAIRSGTFAATPATVALTSAAFPIAGTIYSYIIPSTTYSGAVTVGSGGTFTSLTNTSGLFDMINQGVLSGSVTATITSDLTSETGTVALNAWGESGAGGYTLTIQPSGARTISGTNATALIKLNGADRVTFNGLNSGGNTLAVTNTNAGTTATVIWIASANAADGANNNTIQNCTIYGAGTSTTVTCINAGSGTVMGNPGEAPNNNNSILNNTIYEAQNGIWVYGPLTGYDLNWTITGNTIGSGTAAQMMSYRGIGIQDVQNFAFNNNTIFGITSANSSGTMAVLINANINGGTVNSNTIYNIKSTYNGGSSLYYGTNAWGICLNAATNASNLTVANNVIYDVSAYGSSQYVQSQGIGILVNTGGGYKVYYNSVNMATNQTQTSSTPDAIAVLITVTGGIDLRNNSFTITETVGIPRAIYSYSPNTVYSSIDYNDYYETYASGYLGIMNNATNCSTLAAWQTASAQDTHSKAANPTYTSTTNLLPLTGSPLISAATPVSVTTDILGVTRNSSTPTMGAYEIVLCTTPGIPTIGTATVPGNNQITVSWTAGSPAGSTYNIYRSTGACPGGTYTKVKSGQTSSPWTDTTVSGGTTYSYAVTGVDSTGGCESAKSGCAAATATGTCTAPPTFAGLASVTNPGNTTCTLNLSWSAGTSNCSGTISYSIYRSTSSSFTPGAGNILASGQTGTSYSDGNVLTNGTTYYYIVQAVDSANATTDGNVVIKSGVPTGPVSTTTLTETFETAGGFDLTGWTHNYITGTQDWAWSTAYHHDGTHSWFAADIASASDMVLVSPSFGVGSTTTLSFWHTYAFESGYDGGTIEYTTNGGTTWTMLPVADYTLNAPSTVISTSFSNPIGGETAWSGGTVGTFTQVTANLGGDANLLNKTIKLRWHEGNDSTGASTGWYVDSVVITNAQTQGSCISGCVAPGAPTLNSATGACSGVNLAWSPGSGSTSSYNVYRSTNTSCPVGTLTKIAGPITATTYADTTAVAGTTYTYVVTGACDAGGAFESGNSNCLAAARLAVPAAPAAPGVSDVSACALSGVSITWSAVSGATSYDLYVDSTTTVTGVTSPYTYSPGNTSSHNYQVRGDNACGNGAWSAATAGTDTNNAPGAPTITAVADVSPCAQSGITITYTAGSGATSHNLLKDGVSVVTGYTSGATYVPGDTSSHTYIMQAVLGACTTLSTGVAGTDANGAPGAPTITSITDVSACAQSGIQINFTAGSPAGSSCNLQKDGVNVVSGYTSGATYNPGDTSSHTYNVQAVLGACTTLSSSVAGTDVDSAPGAPTITSITDVSACAQSGIQVNFTAGSPAGSSYNLQKDGVNVVSGYTSGATYTPGDTSSHTYIVQAVMGSCTTLSAGVAGTDANGAPGAPTITSITDVSACAQSGIQVNFTAGSPAGSSYNLLNEGGTVVTGYTSGTTYNPGDTSSHTYYVQAVAGSCTTDSTGSAFADADNAPGAPVITGITDIDACASSGIQVNYTAGSGAASHDLYEDGTVVVSGYTSGATYVPGDTLSHTYVVRAVSGACYTDSTGVAGTDASISVGAPVITSVTDVDACATSGIRVSFTAGSGAASHNLLEDGTVVVTGYTSGDTYLPGDNASHTYGVRGVNGSCYTDSTGVAGTDANNAPAAPAITSVTDLDACASSGIQINYTPDGDLLFGDGLESLAAWSTSQVTGTSGAWTLAGSDTTPVATVHGGASMGIFNSYSATAGDQTLLYQTTGMSIAGSYTAVSLNFYMFHDTDSINGDSIQLQVSTDGGATWTNAGAPILRYTGTAGWAMHTLDLSSYAGGPAVQIGFLGTSAAGMDMLIDDVSVTASPAIGVTYNLFKDGTLAVTGYASGATYNPGDNASHTYVVQAVSGSCTADSTGVAGTDANNTPATPVITAVSDVDACATSGVTITYTTSKAKDSTSYNLYVDGALAVTGYASGATYNPGDNASHTYVVRAAAIGGCYSDSTGVAGTDANNTPAIPVITAVSDVDACATSGVTITYTTSKAKDSTSYNLYVDGTLAVTGYASGATYNPGDNASHTYVVRAVSGTCTADSTGVAGTDANNTPAIPVITAVSDVDACATSGVTITYTTSKAKDSTSYNLYVDGTLAVTGYASGATYNPGDNASHTYVVRAVSGTCTADSTGVAGTDANNTPAIPVITAVSDVDACATSGVTITYTTSKAKDSTSYNLYVDGTLAVTGYASGATYNPGDNASHTYVVRAVSGTCTADSTGVAGTDANNTPATPVITAVSDVDACATSGVTITYTTSKAKDSTSYNLYVDGTLAVTGYASGATYNPGDNASHTYTVRAIIGSCFNDSTGVAGVDASNAPGAASITGITDIDSCAPTGIQVVYTAGSGATSHNLLEDGVVVVTGYTSGATYVPGDTATHTYMIQAVSAACTTNSAGVAGTDTATGDAATPVITSVVDVDACAASGVKVNYATGDSLPLSDDLESLAGWTSFQFSGTSGAWTAESGGSNPSCSPYSGLSMAMFNSYAAASGDETLLYLTTGMGIPSVYTSVTWSFYMYHDSSGTQNDSIQPQVSTDGGTTWYDAGGLIQRYSATDGWVLHTLDLTAYKGNTNVQIGFLGVAGGGNNMFLDAVSVTGARGTVTYNLLMDGSPVVAGYASGDTYVPGDTSSHTYVIQAVAGSCTTGSTGVAGTDANDAVGAPGITSITDVSACDQNGIKINYTAGTGAVSHDLYKDGVLAVAGYASGAIYNPGDTANHTYAVRSVHGTCFTDSTGSSFADDNTGAPPGAPAITLITDESECAATGIHINYASGTGASGHNLLKDGSVAVTGYASGDLYVPGDTASHTYQVQAVNTGGCTADSTGAAFSDMDKELAPPLILGVSDANECAADGIKVFFNPGSGNVAPLSYDLVMDGTVVVTGYTSGATFVPGDTLTHTYVVRVVSGYCASDSTPQPGADVDNHLAIAAAITGITDNDACGLGLRVYYTGAPGAVSHNLLKDGSVAVTGYASGATYTPGDTSGHTYVIQGVKGACTLNSAGSAFSDVNNTPGAPVITSITDNDAGVQDGIYIYYTGGSGAVSHDLYKDGFLVAGPYVSGTLYNPGDTASHYYVIRAIHATCHTDSAVAWSTDAAGGGTPPPEAAPGDSSSTAQNWSSKTDTTWPAVSGATGYTLYRGIQTDLPNLLNGGTNSCIKYQGSSTTATDTDSPASVTGQFFWYIVTASNASGEGPAGNATAGPRYLNAGGTCP